MNSRQFEVVIFSSDFDQAVDKMNSLVKDQDVERRTIDSIKTTDNLYTAKKFNKHERGNRYWEVYVTDEIYSDNEAMFLIKCYMAAMNEDGKLEERIHLYG